MGKPTILFPADYLNGNSVDENFTREYSAAISQAELSVALFDLRKFEERGVVSIHCDNDISDATIVVYRGWMMKQEEYERFYTELSNLGAKLITNPAEYANLHLFPNVYRKLRDDSPKTLVFNGETARFEKVVSAFDRFIIKDHVKSVKGFDFPSPIETAGLSEEGFVALLDKFRNFRGDLFTGGFVFKQFVEYKHYGSETNEWRCFYLNRNKLVLECNSGQPKNVPSPFDNLIFKYSELESDYYTIDFAELEDGSWTIIEAGDGQVSGMASGQNPMLYYTALSEALNIGYPNYDLLRIHSELEEIIDACHTDLDAYKHKFNTDLFESYVHELEGHIEGSLKELDGYMRNRRTVNFTNSGDNEEFEAIEAVHFAVHPTWHEEFHERSKQWDLVNAEERAKREQYWAELEEERKNDIDEDLAFRYDFDDEGSPEWIWCLVGNIVDERFHGGKQIIKEGTKHFRPGAKVYCVDAYWGMGGERYQVIGLPRNSKKLIKITIDRKLIHNFRLQKVFDKRIINSGGTTWSNTNEAQILIKRLAEWYNQEAAELEERLNAKMRQLAYDLAAKAHYGQLDKYGNPYINHILAVEQLVSTPKQKIIALLHGVVKDTDVTLEDIKPFGKEVVKAIAAITKQSNEKLEDYFIRVEANPLARAVKIASLTYNSDLTRIPNPTEMDLSQAKQYQEYITLLEKRKD